MKRDRPTDIVTLCDKRRNCFQATRAESGEKSCRFQLPLGRHDSTSLRHDKPRVEVLDLFGSVFPFSTVTAGHFLLYQNVTDV